MALERLGTGGSVEAQFADPELDRARVKLEEAVGIPLPRWKPSIVDACAAVRHHVDRVEGRFSVQPEVLIARDLGLVLMPVQRDLHARPLGGS